MKDKVKVIRKSNEVLVKAIQPQFPISGGPAQMVLTGGGGGAPRKKKSLPVRILGGAGALAGGGLGALGTLTGRHRSAGSLLQGAISGAATGSALGRGLGEKTGGLVGVGTKAAYDMRGSPTERMGRQFARMPREQNKGGSRLTYRGQPIVGGKVQVTGGSPREDGTEGTSTSAASNVINAATSENRIPGPGEVNVTDSSNPLAGAETGNPLDAMSPEQEAAIQQQLNPKSNQVLVDDTTQRGLFDDYTTGVKGGVDAAGNDVHTIDEMGMGAVNMIQPVAAGASQEIAADDKAAEAAMNLNSRPAFSRPAREGQGTIYPEGQSPTRSLFADTSHGRSARQRGADLEAEKINRLTAEIAMNQAYEGQNNLDFGNAFPDYVDPNALMTGEPMDMAFRLLKMMAFYYR